MHLPMLHRIRRQIVELELSRERGATEVQRQVSRLMQEQVLPALERQFDTLAPAGTWLRLDRLDLNLGTLQGPDWQQLFVKEAVAQLSRQLAAAVSASPQATAGADLETVAGLEDLVSPSQTGEPLNETGADRAPTARSWDVLEYYLRTGRLPWYALHTSVAALLEELTEQAGVWAGPLRRLALAHPVVLERLWQQCEPGQLRRLLAVLLDATEAEVTPLLVPAEAASSPVREVVRWWHTVLLQRIERPGEALSVVLLRIVRNEAALPIEPQAAKALPADFDFVAVEQAGLVLLAPYLPAFLEATGLVEKGQFKNEALQHRAVHLLAYLGSGGLDCEEPALVLPKLLCGMQLETPVPGRVVLTETERTECTQLLEAVIRNWPVLKNTAVAGLQSGFLQRNGQLLWHEGRGAWLLRVERMAQDVLLDRLPWGFSVVKLPWMEQMLQVEW